jgi:hypothetical protein
MVCILDPNNPSREELIAFFNSEEIQATALEYAKTLAEELGLEVTFHGVYRQGFLEQPDLINFNPFVIGQNQEHKRLVSSGTLQGVVLELMKGAFIFDGIINSKQVRFTKRYVQRMCPFSRINENPIFYEGTKGAEEVYRGSWRFNSDVGDLARNGTFDLFQVN